MFRIGGQVAEGITSGLSPRQGYATNEDNLVKENDFSKMKMSDLGNMNIGQLREISKSMAYKPKTNVWDYIGEIGLDLMSRPTTGNIVSDIGTSMREPYSRYIQRKGSADEQAYGSEADMFKTMLTAQAEVLGAEKEGKGWLEQWKFEQIPVLNKTISELTKKQPGSGHSEAGTITEEEELQLQNAIDQKGRIVSIDPVTAAYLGTKDGGYMVTDEMDRLLKEDEKLPKEERTYKGKRDSQLAIDAIDNVKKRLGLKEGGRVGYQSGNMVQPNAMQAAMPMDQGTEAPPEVQNIDYETLRARLPATITDDIVRLIASSAEAMEDFATIQTQQDINNFNEKYGVELVLPAEA
jgi:hypothetical protein